jgi:transposase
MGAPAKQDWREARRRRAWELKHQGWKQRTIAQALGVSEGAVSQWLKRGREQGEEALAAHPPRGVPARLTPEHLQRLPSLLEQGAEHYGFRGQVWTSRRVAATPDGQLFFQMQAHTSTSADVIALLQGLLDNIVGPLVVIWDGAPIHRSKALRTWLAEGAAQRLHLERLPGYAPQLNPDEGIWQWLKRWDLRNLCCRDLAHLEQELLNA